MANVLRRDFYEVGRAATFTIVPIGDIHIGAAGCDEEYLKETVNYIKRKKNAYWIGMGDYIDAINMSDPRFDPKVLAPWVQVLSLVDLVEAQLERFLEIVSPIADRCLCLLTGNHEDTIKKYYERDVFREIVSRLKLKAGHPADYQMALDYYGWLILSFHSKDTTAQPSRNSRITFNLHHGFGGGKLAGGKALNLEKWLWNHDADIVIFGHVHNGPALKAAVEYVDTQGNLRESIRKGIYSGTYLSNQNGSGSTYAERKGYFPLPVDGVEIVLKPQAHNRRDMIRIVT